jgi:hypothetical protein
MKDKTNCLGEPQVLKAPQDQTDGDVTYLGNKTGEAVRHMVQNVDPRDVIRDDASWDNLQKSASTMTTPNQARTQANLAHKPAQQRTTVL